MKFKWIAIILVMVLFGVPVLAQNGINIITFNNFGFSFDSSLATNVNVTQFPGDAPDLEQPGGPEVAHTQFVLYSQPPAPESMFDASVAIRVYRIADFAGYEFPAQQLQQLQALISNRPDLAQFMVVSADNTSENALPLMPAAQVIRARAQYVQTPSLLGVSYVTVFRQDVSPFTGGEFLYTFQGMSNDGAYYVSAIARLSTNLFPAEIPSDFDMDQFNATFNDYLNQSVATLNNAAPEDFTPSLTALEALVQTFSFGANAVPAPGITATPAVSDITFGGLGGVTWMLVSFGSLDAPISALPNTPVTLMFSATGAGGSTGCNQYTTTFQFENNSLTFGPIISTKIACEQAIMDQETAYLNALATATAFQISDSQLQITYDGGVLTFTAGAPTP